MTITQKTYVIQLAAASVLLFSAVLIVIGIVAENWLMVGTNVVLVATQVMED